jgi:Leucine-rich repeat (LRR) protein
LKYFSTSVDINKLQELNLSKNLFTQNQITEFIDCFDDNNELRKLDLSSLKINDNTFHRLATKLLYKQSHLTTLLLDNNYITAVGLDDVAGILSYNRSLRHLYLRNNWLLTNRSVSLAVAILNNNMHISTFDFFHSVHEDTDDTRRFADLLRRNRNMRRYYNETRNLTTNSMKTVPLALWPDVLCNLKCPDDFYDLLSSVIVSMI